MSGYWRVTWWRARRGVWVALWAVVAQAAGFCGLSTAHAQTVFAQAVSAQTVPALLESARSAIRQAETTYAASTFLIDQPLWREAVGYAQAAEVLGPDDPEPKAVLAEVYTKVRWFVRAWDYWQDFLALGGTLGPDQVPLFAESGAELGFALYGRGDLSGALEVYLALAETLPPDSPGTPEALAWTARILTELGEPEAALPYWQQLRDAYPENETYAYFLTLAEEQTRLGPAASRAFRDGLAAYEAGDLGAARDAFLAAVAANPTFVEALAWAGRSSLELGDPAAAERYWRQVIALDSSDARAQYFVDLAAAQQRWGVQAATAFYEGQERYAAGDLAGALERFDYAALLNPDYHDALAWAARVAQEQGDPARAARYWRTLLDADPGNRQARYFLDLTLRQQEYGEAAGQAFAEGVAAFEQADLATAEARFRDATALNPDFALAWGWLGRIHFTQERYAEAASAYAEAARLEPDNADYRFFADEARALAGDP